MKFFSVFILITFCSLSYAHQPVINDSNPNKPNEAYLIEKPEISKAIYSKLNGDPHY